MERFGSIVKGAGRLFCHARRVTPMVNTNSNLSNACGFQSSPMNLGATRFVYQFCSSNKEPPKQPSKTSSVKPQNPQQTPPDPQPEPQPQPQPQQKSKQLQPLSPQQLFNLYLGYSKDHKFQTDLIVAQQNYKKDLNQLKQAILFQDLLKKQLHILIYDTQGKPYFQHLARIFFMLLSIFGTVYCLIMALKTDKKFRIYMEKTPQGRFSIGLVKVLCSWMLVVAFWKNLRMTKRYVEKIVYHTEDETFTFTKRKFYGARYEEKISRFKILYTENPVFIKRGTNYFNIENQNQYKIGYTFAWKKEDLFSHLISQRIRT